MNIRPAPYSTIAPPAPGTRVRRRGNDRLAVIQKYRPGHPLNLFPIAYLDGSCLWEMVGVDDVRILTVTAVKTTAA